MTKRDIFSELMTGMHELKHHKEEQDYAQKLQGQQKRPGHHCTGGAAQRAGKTQPVSGRF